MSTIEKTRENIQQLMRWVRAVEQALPMERYTVMVGRGGKP